MKLSADYHCRGDEDPLAAGLREPTRHPTRLLLVVDPQIAFGTQIEVPGVTAAVGNMRRLVQWWRWSNDPIVFTQHTYRDPSAVGRLEEFLPGVFEVLKVGAPGAAFYPGLVKAADTVVEKTRFSALADTTLSAHLRSISASEIVICGLTTPICVQATVDDLAMADYSLTVVADACASQATGMLSASEAHTAAIERMGSLFARIESATSMLASSRAYVRHREVNRERAA